MAPVMRQSCDRCHSQKLRCPRAGNKLGACDRCLRKGVQCVYSSSLPKGRPSIYSVAGKTRGASVRPRGARAARLSSNIMDVCTSGSPAGSANSYVELLEDTNQTPLVVPQPQPELENSSLLAHSVGQGLNVRADPQPPIASSAWGESQANRWLNPIPAQPAHNTSIGLSQSFDDTTSLMNWGSLVNESSNVQHLPFLPKYHQGLENCNQKRQDSTEESSDDDGSNAIIITQLSQLIMRFSRLHQLTYDLASKSDSSYLISELNQAHQEPLIDESAFGSVSEWLINDPPHINLQFDSSRSPNKEDTTSNVLCRVFSASHTFLETLHGLRRNVEDNYPIVLRTSISTPSTSGPDKSPRFTLDTASTPSSQPPSPPSYHCNSVIRHLAISCYTVLLSIYTSVLRALELDASTSRHEKGVVPGKTRLTSIVQLCSYLIERQHKAIEVYLRPQKPPQASWEELLSSGFDQTNAAVEEEMGNLHTEVQQRLTRLKQTLPF
ncbi:hypothetical protein F5Y09DRAFT_297106 [Xylaria sp. FL1042]|nr:hypothetical protein F5Y09DRAFT_297106 [Xylaria sp. FL1042]